MFCNNCGNQLNSDARFCNGCGAPVGGTAPAAQPVPTVTSHTMSIVAKNFSCNGCGASLEIPKNARGNVKCKFCGNESVLDGIIKNAEIAAKENIESGVPLSATPAKLHSVVVAVLSKSPNIPLDVFEKVEVVREEHYCVPAYLFSCNGTETFTYDVANIREHKTVKDLGDRVRTEWEKYEEWDNGKSSTASIRKVIIASGNRDMVKRVQSLYGNLDSKNLIDIEELIFPADVDTVKSDVPQTMAFNEFAVPVVEKALKEKAVESLVMQKTRRLNMNGPNIQKDTVRIFLGMYRVVFKHDDKEYSVWVNGNGSRWYWNEGLPEDLTIKEANDNRQREHNEKKLSMEKELESIPKPNTGVITFLMWACIIGAFVTVGISLILAIIFGVIRYNMKKPYKAQQAEIKEKIQKEIDGFTAQTLLIEEQSNKVIQQFKDQKKALRGIYEQVSGNESAF